MGAVGKTPIGFKFIRISSHTPKKIQEGSAEIICEDIDTLSPPTPLSDDTAPHLVSYSTTDPKPENLSAV